jgi:hypothetical protein
VGLLLVCITIACDLNGIWQPRRASSSLSVYMQRPLCSSPLMIVSVPHSHVLVNTNMSLMLLDFFVISDQELIEGSSLGPRFGSFSEPLECVLPRRECRNPDDHMLQLHDELQQVREQRENCSPVIIIQRAWRGALVRRTLNAYHRAASAIQLAFRRHRAV